MKLLLLLPLSAAIPTFHINLDLPPEKRWTEVTQRFREEGLAMLSHMRSVLRLAPSRYCDFGLCLLKSRYIYT